MGVLLATVVLVGAFYVFANTCDAVLIFGHTLDHLYTVWSSMRLEIFTPLPYSRTSLMPRSSKRTLKQPQS